MVDGQAAMLDALDRNFRVASGETFSASESGAAYETRDVLCVACGFPIAEFNWAFLKLPGAEAERGAEEAERFFAARRSPFRFVVRAGLEAEVAPHLIARGHARLEKTTPGMAIEPLRPAPPPPAGLRIVQVDSAETLADFQRTAFAGFGMPPALGSRFLTRRLLETTEAVLLVGYVEGAPVSTSLMLATGNVAGVYWVATLETHRRRGLAEALTWAALEAGRARGCTIGSLQASEMGRPVYERMGFVKTADYLFFEAGSR